MVPITSDLQGYALFWYREVWLVLGVAAGVAVVIMLPVYYYLRQMRNMLRIRMTLEPVRAMDGPSVDKFVRQTLGAALKEAMRP